MNSEKSTIVKRYLCVLGIICLFFYIFVFSVLLYRYINKTDVNRQVPDDYKEEIAEKTDSTSMTISHSDPGSGIVLDPTEKLYRDSLVSLKGNGNDQVTIMIYMNGSNLESDYGSATADIKEMLDADLSDKVSVVIETIGTYEWQRYNIASDHSQRYLIDNHKLILVDDTLDQEDCTDPDALSDFIIWSKENYPADRYFLILWDHGGGSVDGFGYNEWGHYSDALTLDEMQTALKDGGVVFDFIGFDSCIMSSIEVCYALYDYCDYMILSEDFESSLGWFYKNWLTQLADNTSIDTPTLARTIIDDMVIANEKDHALGDASTLALIDEKYLPALFEEWKNFAYANEDALLERNYSREVIRSDRALPTRRNYNPLLKVDSELKEYYVTDMLAVAASINATYTKSLSSLLNQTIVYYNYTANNAGLTGLSVTLPYGDPSFYRDQKEIYELCGFDQDYIDWLEQFTTVTDDAERVDYNDIDWENSSGFSGSGGLW